MLNKNLPVIELTINPADGSFVHSVALVNSPAIEMDFLAFSKQENFQFAADPEKMELIGVAMVPNQKIFRSSKEFGDYYCTFSAETIRLIAQTLAQKGLFNATNLEHTATPADSFIFQSYLTSSKFGINAPNGVKTEDGSLVLGMKVNSENVWNKVLSGEIKGFSVEGIFNMIDTKTTHSYSQNLLSELEAALAELEDLERLQEII